jgi:hypothetical protein
MAARGNASSADAEANFVGWLMPTLTGYATSPAFPAYASTELRGDSNGSLNVIVGDVAWPNVAGAHTPPAALVALHNVSVSGSFSVTDDVNSPASLVIISGDEAGQSGVFLAGGFSSFATTHLASVLMFNVTVGGVINCGVTADSSALSLDNCVCNDDVAARLLAATSTVFNTSDIVVAAAGTAEFYDCRFLAQPTLTALNSATFDGTSWKSFLEALGTRTAGTVVLVVGGYSGAQVEGASLPTTGVNTDVSLNGTGASVGYTGSNSGNHYQLTGLNADGASITFKLGGGEKIGDTIAVTKADLAAHAYAVKNNGGATIATIPSGGRGFVVARYDGTEWVFLEGGSLAA